MNKIYKYKQKAFTLIELLVVIAIIGLLSAVVLASLESARSRARDSQRIQMIKQIETALEMYYQDHGQYPAGDALQMCHPNGWNTPIGELVTKGYLGSIPKDPLNFAPYCFLYTGPDSTIQSAWYCDGVRRTDFEYSIFLALENENTIFLPVTVGEKSTHCLVGPRK